MAELSSLYTWDLTNVKALINCTPAIVDTFEKFHKNLTAIFRNLADKDTLQSDRLDATPLKMH